MASNAAASRTVSTARALAEPPDRPVSRTTRCGTVPEARRKDRGDRQAATLQRAYRGRSSLRRAAWRRFRRQPDERRFRRVRARPLQSKRRTPAVGRRLRSASGGGGSQQFSQLVTKFARGPEERILDGFFGGAESVADGAQLQPLVVLHFKDHAFARRQQFHRG